MTTNSINSTLFLGKVWQHFEELPSTNDFLANSGIYTEGSLVTTFNQTVGRGQMGNRWLSEPNLNLAFSIRLNPTFLQANEQFHLNKAVALAVHDVVEKYISNVAQSFNKNVSVKWANDIFIGDKKVCGILIQNNLSGSLLQSSIIGIGLNINQLVFQKEFNATSLRLETGQLFDLFDCIEQLTKAIEQRYLQLKSAVNFSKIHDEYLSKMYRFGEEAIFRRITEGSVFMGKIVGVSATGQLEIMSNRGIEVFDIKEVKFEI